MKGKSACALRVTAAKRTVSEGGRFANETGAKLRLSGQRSEKVNENYIETSLRGAMIRKKINRTVSAVFQCERVSYVSPVGVEVYGRPCVSYTRFAGGGERNVGEIGLSAVGRRDDRQGARTVGKKRGGG
jgi:hypothetical protein